MGKKSAVPSRQYTDEFKIEAVRLAESIGRNQAAKRLDIPDSSLWNWIRMSRSGKLKVDDAAASPVKHSANALEAEKSRLRRELANAKLDVEILKKAAAYFAKESRCSTPGSSSTVSNSR